MKRKLLAVLLSLVMAGSLAACASGSSTEDTEDTAEEETGEEAAEETETEDGETQETSDSESVSVSSDGERSIGDLGGYKIGFFYLPTSDTFSQKFHDILDYAAEVTNCEMEYYDMVAWDSEAISTAVETLVSNGCQGVIISSGSSPSLFEYLNDNGIYYTAMQRCYNDEVAAVVDDSEYNCGFSGDIDAGTESSNYKSGYQLMMALVDEGCTDVAIICGDEGDAINDDRAAGMNAAAEDAGINVVVEFRGSDFATAFSDILSAYGGELDGICSSATGDTGIAAIQTAGYSGKIKFAQFDTPSEDSVEDYMDQGLLSATYYVGASYLIDMYMQLFNALSGADRLYDDDVPKQIPQYLGAIVTSSDEYRLLLEYTYGEIYSGLTVDEILSYCSLTGGEEMTVEEREELVATYSSDEFWSVENIQARMDALTSD